MNLKEVRRDIGKHFKIAIRGRIVLAVASFSVGVAVPMILFQRPELIRSEHAADWAAAFGSLAAALVALGLGLHAARQDSRRHREKAHGAALVFLNPVTETLGFLELIVDNQKDLASPRASKFMREQLAEIPNLLPPEALPFLAHLPENTAKLVVFSAQRLGTVRRGINFAQTPEDLAKRLIDAELFLKKSFIPLGNKLHEQIVGPNETPPWRQL